MTNTMWNLENTTNCEYNKKEADSQIENKLVVIRREREGGEGQYRGGEVEGTNYWV